MRFCIWHRLAVCPMIVLAPFPLASIGQDAAFPDSRAKDEWNQYVAFAKSLQINVREHYVVSEGRSTRPKGPRHLVLKQNQRCALSGGWQELEGAEEETEEYFLANPMYVASISNIRGTQAWKLEDYRITNDGKRQPWEKPLQEEVIPTHSPHLQYGGFNLWHLFANPNFKMQRLLEKASGERREIIIDFLFTYSDRATSRGVSHEHQHAGTMTLVHQGVWCLSSIKDKLIVRFGGEWLSTIDSHYVYQIEQIAAGFPVIKAVVRQMQSEYSDGRKIKATLSHEYQISVKEDVPDEEFRLNHFGLPEPLEIQRMFPRRTPIYWFVFGGLALLGACWALRRSAKRWTRTV